MLSDPLDNFWYYSLHFTLFLYMIAVMTSAVDYREIDIYFGFSYSC